MSSFNAQTTHDPAAVFACWADPSSWHTWDPEVRAASLDGPVVLGATGTMEPTSGPKSTFTITALTQDQTFTNTGSLPGAHLDFIHHVEKIGATTTMSVTVALRGPMARLWRLVLGRGMRDAARSSGAGLLAHLDRTA
ncbi:SRPBCC family protein [Cellulomonas sp. NPDC089187]|uniref:SRPBCC family protein n=1 Tax=Cellulomonas sp. NPDC089187 TaxID=3154970 RepID=UPI00341EA5B8